MACKFRFHMLSVRPAVVSVKVSSVDFLYVRYPAFMNKSFSLLISLNQRGAFTKRYIVGLGKKYVTLLN